MFRLVIAALVASLAAGQNCPDLWQEFGDSCYYLVGTELDWFSAAKFCQLYDPRSYKVNLVSIESPEEQTWLADYAKTAGPAEMGFWTSGNIIDNRQGWVWASNARPFNYLAWAPGEPSGNGDCVQMWAGQNYMWDDTGCDDAFLANVGAMCEVKKVDVPAIAKFRR